MRDVLRHEPLDLLIRDFDFESKPLWFWYDKPTTVLTSISHMDSVGGNIQHDTLRTSLAPLGSREEYQDWLDYVRDVLIEPDILTGHNIDRFDLPLFQAQLIRNGMPLLPMLQTQDTLRLPRKREVSASQENLLNYIPLKATCPIGMPIYKDHLSMAEWEDAAMGWNDTALIERPSSDVHSHAHMREVLIEKGYLAPVKPWKPSR